MENRTVYYTPAPPMPAVLLILERGEPLRTILLENSMTVGRAAGGNIPSIPLHSAIAGRHHGEFHFDEASRSFVYRDLNSLNGTYYNGERIPAKDDSGSEPVSLRDGDVLRIDSTDLQHPDAVAMIFCTGAAADEKWDALDLSDKKEILIGRTVQNGICLHDFTVSGTHAVLQKSGNGWKIADKGSRNGLAVNRRSIEREQMLRPFDTIRIGRTMLFFSGDTVWWQERKEQVYDPTHSDILMRVRLESVLASRSPFTPKKTLLRDISLDIESGDFILILGGAGAGKSTFVKAITGQLRSAGSQLSVKGNVELDGLDLYQNLRMLKSRIGIVPQYPDYRFDDTVYHTIMDAAKLALAGDYSRKEIEARVEDVIGRMMLTPIRDSKLGVISGGQRKRVQVAIKAVGDTAFFTLDEPDAGLDVAGRKDQMDQLRRYISREESIDNSAELKPCAESGNAVLVISHYPDDVAHMYKKVIVLAKSSRDDAGHLAYYGDVPNALSFFGVEKLSDIVMEINAEGGRGRADEFIDRFAQTRGGSRG